MKLIKNKKIARFPKSPDRVKNLLRMCLADAESSRITSIIIVSKDKNGWVRTAFSGGGRLEKLGMCAYASRDIADSMKE